MITMLKALTLLLIFSFFFTWAVQGAEEEASLVVKRDDRRRVLETEFGEISAVEIGDGAWMNGSSFNLHFFKLEPHALFLPVMLHAEMLLYCQSGSGDLTWIDQGKKSETVSLSRGDVYRLRQGSVFFIRSNLGTVQRERLRIAALFANSNEDLHYGLSAMGPYSSIAELVRGFDSRVLQAAFQVPAEVIQTIKSAAKQPLIIQDILGQPAEGQGQSWDWEGRFLRVFMSIHGSKMENKKKKKSKGSRVFNVYSADRDFENCNGWSLTVRPSDLEALKDSNFGAFYVNLTKGAMMAPHWNPMATEIAFVVGGQGMVRIVCSSESGCENQSFRVKEGDVFMVPRFHPMSQTSFNNDSFVFMGFSTAGTNNYPQYLVGKESVFQVIGKDVLAAAFNVDNETIVRFSGQQEEALIVECTSCAEEQFSSLQEEVERRRQQEEARKREEEDERRRRQEEEAERKEEEARKRAEEEEAERKEEEKARKRAEEEERRRREEEEEAKERERKRQEEEAAREEEEEERRQREEQAQREEAERRQREEEAQREETEQRQREEEAQRKEEEKERQRREEEGRGGGGGGGEGGGESEEEAARREEEERAKREREEEHGRGRGGGGGGEPEPDTPPRKQRQQRPEEGERGESEGEAAMKQEEERIRKEREQMGQGSRPAEPPIFSIHKVMESAF